MLHDSINATVGFEILAAEVNINAKSLHRMLSPKGNPQAKTLFPVLAHLQRSEKVRLRMAAEA